MPAQPHYLMVRPDFYDIEYTINPWMRGNLRRVDRALALEQWEFFYRNLTQAADVQVLEPVEGLPDMVFAANGALVLNGKAVPAVFRYPQRRDEKPHFQAWLADHDFEIHKLPETIYFEGVGDAIPDPTRNVLWAGYGVRSTLQAHGLVARLLDVEVLPLRLVDERFYHLDTCFSVLEDGTAIYYPQAFDRPSLLVIERYVPPEKRIEASTADALKMACNTVEAGGRVFLNDCSTELQARIENTGVKVARTDLSQFVLSGGSCGCLVLRLDRSLSPPPKGRPSRVEEREIDIAGHLIDHNIMNSVFDTVVEKGGSFEVLEMIPGVHKEDMSRARVKVTAPTAAQMHEILPGLMRLGARVARPEVDARLEPVDIPGTAPEDFYSTTIYPTDVRIDGEWTRCADQRMDAAIVVEKDPLTRIATARCCLLRDLDTHHVVVAGTEGIRVRIPKQSRDDGEQESFQFMGASVSSERRVDVTVEQIAWEMSRIRERRGKIVVVTGPVTVHTGGTSSLEALIRAGYVQAFLGGNAVAVHDIERDLFGTSLGVDLTRGVVVEGGHRHHIRAINRIRRAGGIRKAVEAGIVKSGIMKALVDGNIPYVLAGSIRDDGPLPDTLMDLVEAQRQYQEAIRGADMILMLSSMLHAIGTGNMTPAGVRLICVDINPAVITKLADRGSMESVGVVTDVGLFLKLLVEKLQALEPAKV